MLTVLKGCIMIDATGAEPVEDAAVIVEGQRIKAAGRAGEVLPKRATVERTLDLEGGHLLPGLINLHVHLGLRLPTSWTRAARTSGRRAKRF